MVQNHIHKLIIFLYLVYLDPIPESNANPKDIEKAMTIKIKIGKYSE